MVPLLVWALWGCCCPESNTDSEVVRPVAQSLYRLSKLKAKKRRTEG
jgi:hypothetical protein